MRYAKSLRVTPRSCLLMGIFFAVWIGLLLVQGPPAEAEDVLGWTGTIKYTQTWTEVPTSFPETGRQTTTYSVDGTDPPAEENGYQYQPATWSETYNSQTDYLVSCDQPPGTSDHVNISGGGSGNTGMLVHFSGTRYQIDAGYYGFNADKTNLQYLLTRSYCDKSEESPTYAKQLSVGSFTDPCDWDMASTTDGSAATTLSGTATNPCGKPDGITETYEWDLTRAPTTHKADIAVSQTDTPDPVAPGSNVTYRVVVMNNGPDGTTGVKLTDTMPQGATFVSATTLKGGCSQAGGTVSCELGALASGASATVDIVVSAPGSAGTLTNDASATAADSDPNSANNSSQETTTVQLPCSPPVSTATSVKYFGTFMGSQCTYWGSNYTLTSAFDMNVVGLGAPTGVMTGYAKATSSVNVKYVADEVQLALYVASGRSSNRPFLNYEGNGITNSQTGERMSFDNYDSKVWRNKAAIKGVIWYFHGTLSSADVQNIGFTPGSNGWPALEWGVLNEKPVKKVELTNIASVGPCQNCVADASVSTSASLSR
jgi:uncharacterized repeat protein (TIGR01451 family)